MNQNQKGKGLTPGCLAMIVGTNNKDADGTIVKCIEKVYPELIRPISNQELANYYTMHKGNQCGLTTKDAWIVEGKLQVYRHDHTGTSRMLMRNSLPIDSKFLLPLGDEGMLNKTYEMHKSFSKPNYITM